MAGDEEIGLDSRIPLCPTDGHALVGLVPGRAPIDAILRAFGRTDVPADIHVVHPSHRAPELPGIAGALGRADQPSV